MEFSGDRVIGTPLKKGREGIKCLTFVGEHFVISIQAYPEEGKTRIGHSFKTEGLHKMNPRGKLIQEKPSQRKEGLYIVTNSTTARKGRIKVGYFDEN